MNYDQIKDMWERKAVQEYDKANKEWLDRVEQEKVQFENKLSNSDYCKNIGLPQNLPQSTIDILKVTMAIDKVGPDKPRFDTIAKKWGL